MEFLRLLFLCFTQDYLQNVIHEEPAVEMEEPGQDQDTVILSVWKEKILTNLKWKGRKQPFSSNGILASAVSAHFTLKACILNLEFYTNFCNICNKIHICQISYVALIKNKGQQVTLWHSDSKVESRNSRGGALPGWAHHRPVEKSQILKPKWKVWKKLHKSRLCDTQIQK